MVSFTALSTTFYYEIPVGAGSWLEGGGGCLSQSISAHGEVLECYVPAAEQGGGGWVSTQLGSTTRREWQCQAGNPRQSRSVAAWPVGSHSELGVGALGNSSLCSLFLQETSVVLKDLEHVFFISILIANNKCSLDSNFNTELRHTFAWSVVKIILARKDLKISCRLP